MRAATGNWADLKNEKYGDDKEIIQHYRRKQIVAMTSELQGGVDEVSKAVLSLIGVHHGINSGKTLLLYTLLWLQ